MGKRIGIQYLDPPREPQSRLERLYTRAHNAYRSSDTNRWVSAVWCNQIVGSYDRGATIGLADYMSVSPDTIEDMAHAYEIYYVLRNDSDEAKVFVRLARRTPYIYISHFRALYDARERYGLSNETLLKLLMDVFQAEGGLSSRSVSEHARKHYGGRDNWVYEAQKVQRALKRLLDQPDFPKPGRRVAKKTFLWLENKLPRKSTKS